MGGIDNGERPKAFNFDLDTKELAKRGFSSHFPASLKPYNIIRAELKKLGFKHRQFSGYRSIEPLSKEDVFGIVTELHKALPWLCHCVKRFDVTDIGAQYDLSSAFACFAKESQTPKQPEAQKGEKESAQGGAIERIYQNEGVGRPRAFNFDLDTKELANRGFSSHFPASLEPYKMIRAELKKLGFKHRQFSGYRSIEPLSKEAVFNIITELHKALPWLCHCVKRFDVTEIREQYDLSSAFVGFAKESQASKQPEAQNDKPAKQFTMAEYRARIAAEQARQREGAANTPTKRRGASKER
jgi:virulence-associated protein VapD